MSDDKIEEIRARHEADTAIATVPNPELPPIWTMAWWRAHDDRATLLAEVERLIRERDEARAEIENLYDQVHRWVDDRAKAQLQADRLREQNYELQRKRDEARAEVDRLRAALKPFSEFYLWPDDAGEWTANDVRSDEDWDEERNDAKTDDVFIKRAHIRAARKALEAKP